MINRNKAFGEVSAEKIKEVAVECCKKKLLMELYYVKKRHPYGKRYEVEPYEMKGGALYAFDPKDNTIKRFNLSGIVQIGNLNKKWMVEEGHERENFELKLAKEGDNDER